ncbi:Dde1p Ecym_4739 [Eremothecium cymbalariae DBVPG|uniref:Uncharacterized protein n=1 Tax=Eremothecium cymbalariae (strain CBS 270.75 / DBVPG 7215 / KCTC 17166 / NRRL Y-17582) TaxID=931890 RepID=G8JSN4_ERECY|nr:hypothetical protein Ecym_4739 [Eremothecium cymbalariae DBVPG\
MLEFWILLQWIITVLLCLFTTNWVIQHVILDAKRDLHPVALTEQACTASVRKENETAVYRNILTPIGYPLSAGLSLSHGYQFRKGNFGDIWSTSMEVGKGNNRISFIDGHTSWTLGNINFKAKLLKNYFTEVKARNVGIVCSVATGPGFVSAIAGFMGTLESCIPHFLPSIPRNNMDLDVLIVDSWNCAAKLNGSEDWYKTIIVCDDSAMPADLPGNVTSFYQLIHDMNASDNKYEYEPTTSFDDDKELARVTNHNRDTTTFMQHCLVSSVSNFIKLFPINQELKNVDKLTIITEGMRSSQLMQTFIKVFGLLLFGGSISYSSSNDLTQIDTHTTLLFLSANNAGLRTMLDVCPTGFNKLKLSWAMSLLSEGVFSTVAQSSCNFSKLRCVYILNEVKDSNLVSSFPLEIPELKRNSVKRLTSRQLNVLRSLFGSRVVMELYSPYTIMGPIAQGNMYDYRIFPQKVDEVFTCYGTLSTSLEGKLIYTNSNPTLMPSKRQGMLVVRGFTIGKPLDEQRLSRALKLTAEFNGGEGWMPMVGVFGIWGTDGCFYEYK